MTKVALLLQQITRTVYDDLRQVWPWLLAFGVALLIGIGEDTGGLSIDHLGWRWWNIAEPFLRPLAYGGLVYSFVRYRLSLPSSGHEYWTRLLSAFLSILLLTGLLVFAAHLVILSALGIFPRGWLGALLWRQFFFHAYFLAPIFMVALTVRHGVGLGIAAALVFCRLWHTGSVPGFLWNMQGTPWIRLLTGALTMLIGVAVVAALRRFGIRFLGVWATLLIVAGFSWHAFRIEQRMPFWVITEKTAHETISPTAVQLGFDKSRIGKRPKETLGGNPEDVVIPVRTYNIPDGLEIEEGRSSFTIEGRNEVWHSGWLEADAFVNLRGGNSETWFRLEVDPGFYSRNRELPVRVTVDSTLTVIRSLHPEIKVHGDVADVAGFGQCKFGQIRGGSHTTICSSPAFRWNISENELFVSFPEIPAVPSFGPLYVTKGYSWTAPVPEQMTIVARVAEIKRGFVVNEILMKDYWIKTPPHADADSISF